MFEYASVLQGHNDKCINIVLIFKGALSSEK